jgi:hypothetical protein
MRSWPITNASGLMQRCPSPSTSKRSSSCSQRSCQGASLNGGEPMSGWSGRFKKIDVLHLRDGLESDKKHSRFSLFLKKEGHSMSKRDKERNRILKIKTDMKAGYTKPPIILLYGIQPIPLYTILLD